MVDDKPTTMYHYPGCPLLRSPRRSCPVARIDAPPPQSKSSTRFRDQEKVELFRDDRGGHGDMFVSQLEDSARRQSKSTCRQWRRVVKESETNHSQKPALEEE